jgi:zinc and cadmium transporter
LTLWREEPLVRPWTFALGSVLLISLIPLAWLLVAPRRAAGGRLLSFAVGALLGSAVLHLLPEAIERLGPGVRLSGGLLAGFLGFFVLEKFLGSHSHASTPARLPPLATLNLLGDGLHNVLDGALVAAAYSTDVTLGVTTTVAVVLREIPQEIGDMGVLTYAGVPLRRAVWYNFASGLAALGGATLTLVVGARLGGATDALLPVAAGAFIYIAASDLIPELRQERSRRAALRQILLVLLGVAMMTLPLVLD